MSRKHRSSGLVARNPETTGRYDEAMVTTWSRTCRDRTEFITLIGISHSAKPQVRPPGHHQPSHARPEFESPRAPACALKAQVIGLGFGVECHETQPTSECWD